MFNLFYNNMFVCWLNFKNCLLCNEYFWSITLIYSWKYKIMVLAPSISAGIIANHSKKKALPLNVVSINY